MLRFLPHARVVLAAVAVGLPFAASGACGGGTACFQYNESEYAFNGDSCPAQNDALPNFSDPDCPGPVVSVNSAGTFDGQLCCYAVTYDRIVPDCGTANPTTSSGIAPPSGVGGSFSTSVVTATASTGPACFLTCSSAMMNGGAPCGAPDGVSAYDALQSCACNGTLDSCAGSCPVFCQSGPLDATCNPCLESVCNTELMACLAN